MYIHIKLHRKKNAFYFSVWCFIPQKDCSGRDGQFGSLFCKFFIKLYRITWTHTHIYVTLIMYKKRHVSSLTTMHAQSVGNMCDNLTDRKNLNETRAHSKYVPCSHSPKAIPRGKWTDERRYPFGPWKTNQKPYPRGRNEINHDTVSLTESANDARSDDTSDTRFYDCGISSRRAYSQETNAHIAPSQSELPASLSGQQRWAWFKSVITRILTNSHERR